MKYDITKLLPVTIREGKWAEFVSAFWETLGIIDNEKISQIKNRNDIDEMNEELLREMCYYLGLDIPEGFGYIETKTYLKRQLFSIVPRIKNRSTWKGYQYIYYIYNTLGHVYPLLHSSQDTLTPWLNWINVPEISDDELTLDYEFIVNGEAQNNLILDADKDNILRYETTNKLFFDTPPDGFDETTYKMDNPEIPKWDDLETTPVYADPRNDNLYSWTLDFFNNVGILSAHILLKYKLISAETESAFMSEPTLNAFRLDIYNMKKTYEVPHLQIDHTVNVSGLNTARIEELKDADGIITGKQVSIIFSDNLSNVAKVKFGRSRHIINNEGFQEPINDIADALTFTEYLLSDFEIIVQTQEGNHLTILNRIKKHQPFIAFSEVGLFDSDNHCIVYTCFPEISIPGNISGSWYLDFNIL